MICCPLPRRDTFPALHPTDDKYNFTSLLILSFQKNSLSLLSGRISKETFKQHASFSFFPLSMNVFFFFESFLYFRHRRYKDKWDCCSKISTKLPISNSLSSLSVLNITWFQFLMDNLNLFNNPALPQIFACSLRPQLKQKQEFLHCVLSCTRQFLDRPCSQPLVDFHGQVSRDLTRNPKL